MARGIHKLTAGDLRRTEPGLYSDGGGLYLRITDAGAGDVWRSWIGRYGRNGRTRDMGLGPVSELGLAAVRKLWHGELRPLLRQGIDPIERRRAGRAAEAAAAARAVSVDACIDGYYAAHCNSWRSASHRRAWLRTLREIFSPAIGTMPVAAVERQDIVRALQPFWSTTQESALRTARRLKTVFDWAIACGYRAHPNPALWVGGLEHLLPRTKTVGDTRLAALPYRDLPAFMAKLRASDRLDARALEFLILCAGRPGEVVGARWSEINFASGIWIVPAERMKAGREHRVPLSPQALRLLQALPRTSDQIFSGVRGGPMNPIALLRLLAALGFRGITAHGFRSAFRDWVAEQTHFSRELAETALAHVVGSAVERAYQRGDMIERRARLMSAWAEYLARPQVSVGAVVTPLHRSDRHA
jgi:integrase